ncbi:26015_t:CDS:1, partial [Racocetra persica]
KHPSSIENCPSNPFKIKVLYRNFYFIVCFKAADGRNTIPWRTSEDRPLRIYHSCQTL